MTRWADHQLTANLDADATRIMTAIRIVLPAANLALSLATAGIHD